MGACCGAEVTDTNNSAAPSTQSQKILFLGTGGCGKSTLFRQLRRKYGKGFSNKERRDAIRAIHTFVVDTMQEIFIFHDVDNPEEDKQAFIESLPSDDAQRAAKHIISVDAAKVTLATAELSDSIRTLWAIPAIKARFAETVEFAILRSLSLSATNTLRKRLYFRIFKIT